GAEVQVAIIPEQTGASGSLRLALFPEDDEVLNLDRLVPGFLIGAAVDVDAAVDPAALDGALDVGGLVLLRWLQRDTAAGQEKQSRGGDEQEATHHGIGSFVFSPLLSLEGRGRGEDCSWAESRAGMIQRSNCKPRNNTRTGPTAMPIAGTQRDAIAAR